MYPDEPKKRMRLVYLGDMGGDDFQTFCTYLLDELGYESVIRVPKGPDGGKDIIITHRGKVIYVECRHWPEKAIGRPDIQKLNSAAAHEGADRSIFITTGWFSGPAVQYLEGLDPPMQLIDGVELAALAERAGYRMKWGRRPYLLGTSQRAK